MTTFITLAVLFTLALLYLKLFRPWQLRWGATDEEIQRDMPGDDIVIAPTFNANRGVTIKARAEHIYPWIVQIGVTRAGWYSYDLLDNLARPSAETILPEHQTIQVGDIIPMSPDGKDGLYVKDFEENKWILWWDNKGDNTWVWEITSVGDGKTRLVTRVRVKYNWFSFELLFHLLIEFFDIWMMRKCMLGIKQRAENLALSLA